jgi:SAM-dependent methyltransferase
LGEFLVPEKPEKLDQEDTTPSILAPVAHSFGWSVTKHGPVHRAVAWRDEERQYRRFQIFVGLLAYDVDRDDITINDLGCGYGAMFDTFKELPQFRDGTYFGYDISDAMVKAARENITDPRALFIQNHQATEKADYSFVSGTYNMKMTAEDVEWREYIEENLIQLWSKTRIGLGFNMLNIQSPLREKTLFYGDPDYFTEFCKKHLGGQVRMIDLLHPNEFVIFVRK